MHKPITSATAATIAISKSKGPKDILTPCPNIINPLPPAPAAAPAVALVVPATALVVPIKASLVATKFNVCPSGPKAHINPFTPKPNAPNRPTAPVISGLTLAKPLIKPLMKSIKGERASPALMRLFLNSLMLLLNFPLVVSFKSSKALFAVPVLFSICANTSAYSLPPSLPNANIPLNERMLPNNKAIFSALPPVFLITSSRKPLNPFCSSAAALNCIPISFAASAASFVGAITAANICLVCVIAASALVPLLVIVAIAALTSLIDTPHCPDIDVT